LEIAKKDSQDITRIRRNRVPRIR